MRTVTSEIKPLSSEVVLDYRVFHARDEHFAYTVGMHYHEHYEIFLHECGGTRMVVGQSIYEMAPHELYLIPPFHIHGILTDSPLENYERSWVHITPSCLTVLGGSILSFPREIEHLTAGPVYRFPLSAQAFARLKGILRTVSTLSPDADRYERLRSRLVLSGFFNEICRLLSSSDSQSVTQRADSPIIQQVLNYIAENCTEDLSLDRLAGRFNLSKYYLSHTFSKVYNVSTYRYILLCRIAKAQKLIRSGNLSLTEIAHQCGFNDYSNFLRSFQHLVGLSPREYRNQQEQDTHA